MMNNTDAKQTTDLTRFASDLELAPGSWPLLLEIEGRQFARGSFSSLEGELRWVTYHEQNKHTGSRIGAKLTIFND